MIYLGNLTMESNHLVIQQLTKASQHLLVPVVKFQHHFTLDFAVLDDHRAEATANLRCVQ